MASLFESYSQVLLLIQLPFKFAAMSCLMVYAVIRVGDTKLALRALSQYCINCGSSFGQTVN